MREGLKVRNMGPLLSRFFCHFSWLLLALSGSAFGDCALDAKDYPPQLVTGQMPRITAAAERGDAVAELALGRIYKCGLGVPQNFDTALHWFQALAKGGNPIGQNEIGRMYDDGLGVPRDAAMAEKWYRLAADQGFSWAQYNLAILLGKANPPRYDEAKTYLRLSADGGLTEAQWLLGNLYDQGDGGFNQDHSEAMVWYKKAADQGDARAEASVGKQYYLGLGVPVDYEEARKWFERAARKGNPAAQEALGGIYFHGTGAEKDVAKGCQFYLDAAQYGFSRSEFFAGYCLATGEAGIAPDLIQAYKWTKLAVSSTDFDADTMRPNAERLLQKLKLILTPEQISSAENLVSSWKPVGSP